MKPEKPLLAIWKAISFSRKTGILSGPKDLNGWIFESKSVTPTVLIVIDFMAGIPMFI